jgi:dihydrofolate reductase
MVQSVRVHCINVSADGYGAGEGQSLERPFGHANPEEFFSWAGATASWVNRTDPGGTRGLDDYITRDRSRNIGAEIMGRNKFGPYRGPWEDHPWDGWWGDEPPFHTPVFVLTHYPRKPLTLGETTFHFIEATPEEAVAEAKRAANGMDVRIGGGIRSLRSFIDADLVDEMHISVSPHVLGAGERLWETPEELTDRYHLEKVPSPSGAVVHHFFWRRETNDPKD